MKYPKLLGSSVNPEQLSLTVKGILKNGLAIALAFGPFLNISTDDINHLFDSVSAFVVGIDSAIVVGLSLWGSIQTIRGAVRKIKVSKGLN